MSILSSSYLLLSYLLSASTIILSIILFAIRIPRNGNMKHYNTARYTLASAYLIIGSFNCYKTFVSSIYNIDLDLIRTLTLVSASYQALLFTFALLVLIQPAYVSIKRVFLQFGIILFVFVTLLMLLYNISRSLYYYCYNIVSVIYIFQLIYYTFLFRKKYTQCLKRLKDYYNEDEDNRLRWIKISFYSALSIGIITLFMTHLPPRYYSYFVLVIIIFYIFFAIKYCNYPLDFRYIISAVYSDDIVSPSLNSGSDNSEVQHSLPLSEKEEKLQLAINRWVEEKEFRHADVSRDNIAKSLETDRDFLALFFQNHMKIEFRIRRTQLRIEEAKVLLLEYPDLSISKVGERVGISDRSNFQKKFTELVGISPKNWRKQNLNKSN